MKTQWKSIKGYEGLYEVSNTGLIRNVKRNSLLAYTTSRGYLKARLWDSKRGIARMHRVHRLVAEAFVPNPFNLPEVNHLDENKENNKAENLAWCSHADNIKHSIASGKIPTTKVAQFSLEGEYIRDFQSASEAERVTGIPRTHICKVILGRYGFKSAGGFIWKQGG